VYARLMPSLTNAGILRISPSKSVFMIAIAAATSFLCNATDNSSINRCVSSSRPASSRSIMRVVRAVVCIADCALENVISRQRSNAAPHLFDMPSAFKRLIERFFLLRKVLAQYHYLPLTQVSRPRSQHDREDGLPVQRRT
jgi:hypothetical protein